MDLLHHLGSTRWIDRPERERPLIRSLSLFALVTTVNVTALSLGVSNADGALWFVEAAIMRILTRPPNRRGREIQVTMPLKPGSARPTRGIGAFER